MEQAYEVMTHQKPFLRGHFHQAAFFLALGACSVLIAISDNSRVLLSTIVYGFTLLALFGISSLYHRANWGPQARGVLRRLDHAAIYVFMAGSATPVCLLGVGGSLGNHLLGLLWTGAVFGIVKEIFWTNSPRLVTAVLYLAVGWVVIPYFSEIAAALGNMKLSLILAGGIIYTLGALIYAFKWPNPFPRVLGFHEIFHALVVIASLLHFIAIYQLVRHV